MSLNVFILGRPGSGKSRVAQIIQELASEKGWSTEHIYDYRLLQELFKQEIDTNTPHSQRRFRSRGPKAALGFDVINFEVLDEVLDTVVSHMMHGIGTRELTSPGEKKLQLIEFARNKYEDALRKFGDDLLQDTYLLYINADMENCIERILGRIEDGLEFSHFVSEEIMRSYYNKDDWLEDQFKEYLKSLQRRGIRIYSKEIENKDSMVHLFENIRIFVEMYLMRETEAIPILSKLVPHSESAK